MELGNASSTPSKRVNCAIAVANLSRSSTRICPKPSSPRWRSAAPTRVAIKAWLEQIFEVALSLRICCSRVESTPTRQSRPELSFAFPMNRPGAARTPLRSLLLKRTPKSPRPGPPKLGASARWWASPTMMSAPFWPKSQGALSPPGARSRGSITAMALSPRAAAKSASESTSSMRPKVLT